MEWIKKHASTLVLCLVFLIGVGLIAYPSVADYYNSWLQRNVISSYAEKVVHMDTDRYEEIREAEVLLGIMQRYCLCSGK